MNRAGEVERTTAQRKREKRDVHGWVVLDKPVGMTSTHAVSTVKRLFAAKRAGHAGTQDWTPTRRPSGTSGPSRDTWADEAGGV